MRSFNRSLQHLLSIGIPAIVALAIAGCQQRHDHTQVENSRPDTVEHKHLQDTQPLPSNTKETNASALMLTTTQERLSNISVRKMASGVIADGAIISARVAADEDRRSGISSRVAGRIEKLHVKDIGRPVAAGQQLYEVYSESLNAQVQEYLMLKEQNERLGGQRDHYGDLLRSAGNKLRRYGLTTKQIDALTRERSRITFLSPATGTVSDVLVTEGQYIDEGAPMYRIDNLAKLWLEAELYPTEANNFRTGQKVKARISGIAKTVEGVVSFLTPVYRTNEQIVIMRVAIDNRDGALIPGMQGTLMAERDTREAKHVPLDAVIRDGKGAYAFVRTHDNTYEMRQVNTGAESADDIEITDGLRATDNVVVSGAYLLYSELVLRRGMTSAAHEH